MANIIIRNHISRTLNNISAAAKESYFVMKYSYRLWSLMRFSMIPAFKRALKEAINRGDEVVYTTFFAPEHIGAMIAVNYPEDNIIINLWEKIQPTQAEFEFLEAPELSLQQCWKIQHKLERKMLLPLFLKTRKKHQLKVLF